MNPPSIELLSALADKYRRLLLLRTTPQAEAPFMELRSLARQFPGSLRELNALPLERLETRFEALERVLARGAVPEPWMCLQVSYHGFMRATLRVKRWSRGFPDEPALAQVELAARYVPAADEPHLGFFDAAALRAIRKPPEGRLNPFVLAAVARLHGTTADFVGRALVLG